MRRKPSTWDLLMPVLLIILVILIAHVACNLYEGNPFEVPEAQMMADWQKYQRLAKEYPYQEKRDDGSR